MRFVSLMLALTLAGCATNAFMRQDSLTVDRYRGVYSTHFDGIPDQARVCVTVTNRTERRIDWVRLKLQSGSDLGYEDAEWRSKWIYRHGIAAGESVALELKRPPVANRLEIIVDRAGRGNGPAHGRTMIRSKDCSETQLLTRLKRELATRTAPGIQIMPMIRPNDRSWETLIAEP